MAVRTLQIVHLPAIPAAQNGWLSLYTVPAGRTLIVKDWHFINRTGSGRTITLGVRSGGVEARVHAGGLVAHLGVLASWSRDVVLEPGQELVLFVGGENADTKLDGVVSGALLDGVAS